MAKRTKVQDIQVGDTIWREYDKLVVFNVTLFPNSARVVINCKRTTANHTLQIAFEWNVLMLVQEAGEEADAKTRMYEWERLQFETKAEQLGLDITRYGESQHGVEPWTEYLQTDTGYYWAGWLAGRNFDCS